MNDSEGRIEFEYLCDFLKRRYEGRWPAEAWDEIKKGVGGVLKAAEALRSVKLENRDEPMTRFVPYRKD